MISLWKPIIASRGEIIKVRFIGEFGEGTKSVPVSSSIDMEISIESDVAPLSEGKHAEDCLPRSAVQNWTFVVEIASKWFFPFHWT